MKATIKADGTLFVEAETELEQYALVQWAGENMRPGMTINLKVSWANRRDDWNKPGPVMPMPAKMCMVCGQDHGGLQCPKLTPSAGSPVHSMTCPRRHNYADLCTCGAEIHTSLASKLSAPDPTNWPPCPKCGHVHVGPDCSKLRP